jgi:heavy metal sensor kinase
MFWNKVQFKTVVSRLTFWYAATCTLLAATAFILAYIRLDVNITRDIDKELVNELKELRAVYAGNGLAALQDLANGEAEAEGLDHVFIRMLSPQGDTLASYDLSKWAWMDFNTVPVAAEGKSNVVFSTLPAGHQTTRIAAQLTPDGNILQFGFSLHSRSVLLKKFRRIFITFSCATFLLSIFFGRLIARKTMAGVQRVTWAVSHIRKDNLNSRVPSGAEGQEIDALAEAFNEMLTRIEALVRELNEVSDNIAHDLRSPITRMRGAAETTLTGPQDIEAYQEMGCTILEECDRLAGMINTMLEISRSESGGLEISRAPVELTALLKNAMDLFLPSAEEKQIELTAGLPDDPLILSGDKTRLQRTVSNLIDNAIKYTPIGGKIRLTCKADSAGIRIDVRDSGSGIAPEELPRIFERFYRSEKCRSTQGSGLGLSLAQTIVHAHGGTLTVKSTLGEGSVFTVTLPRRPGLV